MPIPDRAGPRERGPGCSGALRLLRVNAPHAGAGRGGETDGAAEQATDPRASLRQSGERAAGAEVGGLDVAGDGDGGEDPFRVALVAVEDEQAPWTVAGGGEIVGHWVASLAGDQGPGGCASTGRARFVLSRTRYANRAISRYGALTRRGVRAGL